MGIMNLKKFAVLFLTILVIFSPYAHGQQRNLKTPQNRLIGHWLVQPLGVHYYFSPVNESDLMGVVTFFVPKDYNDKNVAGKAQTWKYAVISQEPEGEEIRLKIDPEHVWLKDEESQRKLFAVAKDGKTMKMGLYDVPYLGDVFQKDYSCIYLDSKVSPNK